jgi:prohibitin 1
MVAPREIGIRITMGQAQEKTLPPGYYFKFPIFSVIKILDTTINRSDVNAQSSSMDMQPITTDVAINWSVDPEMAYKIYTTVGDEAAIYERIILPAVNEGLKAEMAKLSAEEILRKRIQLKNNVDAFLQAKLLSYGVKMFDLSILNLQFSGQFTQAVEQKQIAEQNAKKAEYLVKQSIQEAQAEIERAKGQSEAQEILKSSIDDKIIQLKALEKWDGKMPQVVGSSEMPFIGNIDVK